MMDDIKFEESKYDESKRTFETRVLFIKEIFTHKYSQEEILKKCIEHKLNRSYEIYMEEVNRCFDNLINKVNEDPVKVLKNIK